MPKYIYVKKNLVGDKYYGGLYFNPDMKQYCGQRLTFKRIDLDGYIRVEENGWCWNRAMCYVDGDVEYG